MKKHVFTFLLFALILVSCDKGTEVSVGFDSNFDPGGYGMTRLTMDNPQDKIYLEGTVRCDSGAISVLLRAPSGAIIWNTSLSGTNETSVSETFDNSQGDWSLSYESNEGSGYINLSLHN